MIPPEMLVGQIAAKIDTYVEMAEGLQPMAQGYLSRFFSIMSVLVEGYAESDFPKANAKASRRYYTCLIEQGFDSDQAMAIITHGKSMYSSQLMSALNKFSISRKAGENLGQKIGEQMIGDIETGNVKELFDDIEKLNEDLMESAEADKEAGEPEDIGPPSDVEREMS